MIDLNKNGKDDIEEIKEWATDVATDLMAGAARVWEWVKAEAARIEALFTGAMSVIKAALQKAMGDVQADPKSVGQIVADTLTILAREARHLLDEIKSDFLVALQGLLYPAATAPAAS